jgi:hypothetical protein
MADWIFRIIFYLFMYSLGATAFVFFPILTALLLEVIFIMFVALILWLLVQGAASYWKLLLWPVIFWFDENGTFADWVRR